MHQEISSCIRKRDFLMRETKSRRVKRIDFRCATEANGGCEDGMRRLPAVEPARSAPPSTRRRPPGPPNIKSFPAAAGRRRGRASGQEEGGGLGPEGKDPRVRAAVPVLEGGGPGGGCRDGEDAQARTPPCAVRACAAARSLGLGGRGDGARGGDPRHLEALAALELVEAADEADGADELEHADEAEGADEVGGVDGALRSAGAGGRRQPRAVALLLNSGPPGIGILRRAPGSRRRRR